MLKKDSMYFFITERLINFQKLLLIAGIQFETHLKSHILLHAECVLRIR